MYFSDQSNFNRAKEEFEQHQRNKSALRKRRITRRKKSEESRVKEKEQGRERDRGGGSEEKTTETVNNSLDV